MQALPFDPKAFFEKEFQISSYQYMHMMETKSAYSNLGHVALMYQEDLQEGKIYVVDKNQNKLLTSKKILTEDVKNYKKFIESLKFEKLDLTSFGGVNYTYYYMQKKGVKINTIKTFSIQNPFTFKDQPKVKDYIELINFFYKTLWKHASGNDNGSN